MDLVAIEVTSSMSAEGNQLMHVFLRRTVSEPAREPDIEVVFEIIEPEGYFNATESLFFLSATRTDTREAVRLTPQELRLVVKVTVEELKSLV